MYDFSSAEFWVIASVGLVIGLLIGWLLTMLFQRQRKGGKSAQALRKEIDDYRHEVNEHFARTAELFKESTEKYRDLYEHLAGGAQTLATELPDRTQVEFRPGKLLAEQADDESLVEPGLTEQDPAKEQSAA